MYIALSGARNNLGDYLIGDRCRALLSKHKPDEKLIVYDSATHLEKIIDEVHKSKGIIIMGGPGYRKNMYPEIYPLATDLNLTKVPIILLGMGWKGKYGNFETIKKYSFSDESLKLLKYSSNNTKYLGCRDYYTWSVLRNNGFENALMTGCPAWYHLNSIGSPYSPPEELFNIVFTPPANPRYFNQALEIVKVLKNVIPKSNIQAFFHHGFSTQEDNKNDTFYSNQRKILFELNKIGIEGIDVSGNINHMDKYKKTDLHVGYRVHAHIDCLSRRKTSILIYEDGRGAGVDDALGITGIPGWRISRQSKSEDFIPLIWRKYKCKISYEINRHAPQILSHLLQREIQNGFLSFYGFDRKLDNYYKTMIKFIKSI